MGQDLRFRVSGGLARGVLHHFIRPVVGQTIDHLATGITRLVREFLRGHGRGRGREDFHDFVMDFRVHGAVGIRFRLTLGDFGGQFGADFVRFGGVDGGDEGQDGVHGGFLHSEYLSGLWSVLLLFSVPLVSLGTIIIILNFGKNARG